MLKIKDVVDLKELEKFGLKPEFNYLDKTKIDYYKCKSFRVCKNRSILPYNGTNARRYDTLYDLIQAGLVEKVEEVE